jgi:hypothetical protein
VILAAAALGLQGATPPPEVGPEAPADQFSSSRAFSIVEALAGYARPMGSPEHEETRRALHRRLEKLGLEVEEQNTTVSRRRRSGRIEVARIRNILARKRGSDAATSAGGAVLLLAHYDTRPQTYGAADDAAGLAAILETMRALVAAPQTRRDVIVVITDGEEYGLFGARAFVEQSRWVDDVQFLINIEARGNRGPSMMFETTPGNLELVSAFSAMAPFPFANSLSYEVYRRMPNDSDFSAFRGTSIVGLNLASIGNHSSYHTQLDSPELLDRRTLQHHGSNLLALTRYLADLERFSQSGEDAVYFNLSARRLIVYPSRTARLLAVGLALMAAAALFRTRRVGVWTTGGLVRGVILSASAVAGGYLVGFAGWKVLQILAPALLDAPHGRPYRSLWFGAAIACLVIALVVKVVRRGIDGERSLELMAGALLVWVVGAGALSVWIPGASFLLTWPACSAWLAWWIVARAGGDRLGRRSQLVTALGAAPGVVLLAPLLVLFLQALTLSSAGVPAALLGLLLTLMVPQLALAGRDPRVSFVLVAAAAVVVLAASALSGQSEARPSPNTLFFVATDEGSHWYSMDPEVDPWTETVLGPEPEKLPAPSGLALGSIPVLRASAEEADLAFPWVERTESVADGSRCISLKLGSSRGGQILYLRGRSSTAIQAVWIGETRFDLESATDSVRMTLVGASSEVEPWSVRFDLAGANRMGTAALDLEILEQRFGFADLGDLAPRRPPEYIPSSSWRTDSTYVYRHSTL